MARPQLKSLPPPIIYPLDRDMRKRWFVQFYIWHETKQVHVAKKVSGYINTFHVEGERLAAAQELKKNIEDLLKNGWIVGKNKASEKKRLFHGLTVEQALDFVIEKKGNETRERSSQIYITIKKLFPLWLEENGFAGLLIKDLTGEIIQAYLGIGLSQNQVYNLLETQSEELKRELLKEKIDPTSLDVLIENVSEKITGMHYPTEFSTDYFREYYQKKLIENRDNFFVKL